MYLGVSAECSPCDFGNTDWPYVRHYVQASCYWTHHSMVTPCCLYTATGSGPVDQKLCGAVALPRSVSPRAYFSAMDDAMLHGLYSADRCNCPSTMMLSACLCDVSMRGTIATCAICCQHQGGMLFRNMIVGVFVGCFTGGDRGGTRTCLVTCPGCMCLLGYVLNHVLMCPETCPAPCPTLVN